jgi:hypothetical protein
MTMAHRLVHRAGMLGRLATAWGRSGPDFLIIGAQKCGTTSLYNYLLRHPNVAPASKRSIRFFDYEPNWARGPVWYRSHFPFTPGRRPLTGRPLVGESTPAYLFHPLGGERVQKVAPHAQLIVLLRNPVDRAYSHYHHMRRRGREPLGFEELWRGSRNGSPRIVNASWPIRATTLSTCAGIPTWRGATTPSSCRRGSPGWTAVGCTSS